MKPAVHFGLALLISGLLLGCSKGGSSSIASASKSKAFASASGDTKTLWDLAVAAGHTNDLITAALAARQLHAQPSLSEEQIKAADDLASAIYQAVMDGVKKGDTNAQAALEQMTAAARSARMRGR
jgi:hypothetical protein